MNDFVFFPIKIRNIIDDINVIFVLDSCESEWQLVSTVVSKFYNATFQYMAHKLCAKVQFQAINETKSNKKTDTSIMLVVINHKQKYWKSNTKKDK